MTWIQFCQSFQQVVDDNHVDWMSRNVRQHGFLIRHPLQISLALARVSFSSMIDQHSSHHCCSHCTEVSFPLPLDLRLVGKAQKRLVDQRCRLQRVIRPFFLKPESSHRTQLIVNERQQSIDSATGTIGSIKDEFRCLVQKRTPVGDSAKLPRET